jgi:small-conductance mechanosensitive channel
MTGAIASAFFSLLAQATTQPAPDWRAQPVSLFGVKLVGITYRNGQKLLFTIILIAIVVGLSWLLRGISSLLVRGHRNQKVVFWTRQAIHVLLAIVLVLGIVSIWFNEGPQLTTFMGLVTAGVAFALQKPISALAGYVVILRGKTFNVGDRIVMGGVRGDVIELGFIQTTIMEMGEPPSEQGDAPSMWVHARQYTGRLVTISNSQVFDEPIFNYTREFPYIWEEMRLPIAYKDDRHKAEQIILEAAGRHTVKAQEMSADDLAEMQRRYFLDKGELKPHVYFRLTDNWIEMSVRFITRSHGVRALKDTMSREILDALDAAKIGIASSTYDVVGMPPIRVQLDAGAANQSSRAGV